MSQLAESLVAAAAAHDQKVSAEQEAAKADAAPEAMESAAASTGAPKAEKAKPEPFPRVSESASELMAMSADPNLSDAHRCVIDALFAIKTNAATTRSAVARVADVSAATVNALFAAYNRGGLHEALEVVSSLGASSAQRTLIANFRSLAQLGGVASYTDARYLAGLWLKEEDVSHPRVKTALRRLGNYEPKSTGANSAALGASMAADIAAVFAAQPDMTLQSLQAHMLQEHGLLIGLAPLARAATVSNPDLVCTLRQADPNVVAAWEALAAAPEEADVEEDGVEQSSQVDIEEMIAESAKSSEEESPAQD